MTVHTSFAGPDRNGNAAAGDVDRGRAATSQPIAERSPINIRFDGATRHGLQQEYPSPPDNIIGMTRAARFAALQPNATATAHCYFSPSKTSHLPRNVHQTTARGSDPKSRRAFRTSARRQCETRTTSDRGASDSVVVDDHQQPTRARRRAPARPAEAVTSAPNGGRLLARSSQRLLPVIGTTALVRAPARAGRSQWRPSAIPSPAVASHR